MLQVWLTPSSPVWMPAVSYIIFDDVKPETPDTVCLELAETIRNNQLDGVLAIGGGSAIDTAKAAAMIPCLPQPIEDLHESAAPAP